MTGNFGINTADPDDLLHVATSTAGEGAHIGNAFVGVDQDDIFNRFSHEAFKSTASGYAISQASTGLTAINASNNNPILFEIGGEFEAILDVTGNFGINTANPDDLLHVATETAGEGAHIGVAFVGNGGCDSPCAGIDIARFSHYSVKSDDDSYALQQSSAGKTILNSVGELALTLEGENLLRMRIDTDLVGPGPREVDIAPDAIGNVAVTIGEQAIRAEFQVGGVNAERTELRLGNESAPVTQSIRMVTDENFACAKLGIGAEVDLLSNDLVVAGDIQATNVYQTSDQRFKLNIIALKEQKEIQDNLSQIRGVTYNWKRDQFPDKNFDDKMQFGFLAQEVEEIYPDLVHTDGQGFKSINYIGFIPLLVDKLNQQENTITTLEETIKDMNSNEGNSESRIATNEVEIANLKDENEALNFRLKRLEQLVYSLHAEEDIDSESVTNPNTSGSDGVNNQIAKMEINGISPNPFKKVTTINYRLHNAGMVTLTAYTVSGAYITLLNEYQEPGDHSFKWRIQDEFAAGVYTVVITQGEKVAMKRAIHIK